MQNQLCYCYYMNTLKIALLSNATFSILSGLSMLAFNSQLQSLFDFSINYIFPLIGVSLLLFGASVLYVASRQSNNTFLITLITTLDAVWVIGSIIIVAFNPFDLASGGLMAMAIVAIIIAIFASLQAKGKKSV